MLRFYHHERAASARPAGKAWAGRQLIDRIVDGKGAPEDIDRLYSISKANDGTTICGMGDAAGYGD